MDRPLKTASAIVALLAGLVTVVYLLGGMVIALRMLREDFGQSSVVTAIGLLPREVVVTTALVEVIGPALLVGIVAALIYGTLDGPKARKWENDELDQGPHWRLFLVLFGLIATVFTAIPLVVALGDEQSVWVVIAILAIWPITYALTASTWYSVRWLGRRRMLRLLKAAAAGALWAVLAMIPAATLASLLSFDRAQVCVEGAAAPVEGLLIGEGGDQVLLGQRFGEEAGIVSLPSDRVTKTEYGDLSSAFSCPGAEAEASSVAEVALGGHGGELERQLATALRPFLRFDSGERWRPVAVDSFLAERVPRRHQHLLCRGDPAAPSCAPGELSELRRDPEAPTFIDIEGERDAPATYRSPDSRCRTPAPALDCNDGSDAAIYYRRTTHEGRWYWDYWWFFRFNDYAGLLSDCNVYCSDHEGDWEGITVITTASTDPQVLGAIYAAHKDRISVEANLVPLAGTHPVVFVARGTHASYPFACGGSGEGCRQFGAIIGFRLPEEPHDGAVAWGGNDDAECLASECVRQLPEVGEPTDSAPPLAGEWAGWPGKWGRTCVLGCGRAEASPTSPGSQIRFLCPWAPTRLAQLAPDGSVSRSERAGDAERLRATCLAQRAGL